MKMINQNKLQNNINSAFFDEISQISVKNVDLDFEVTKLFSEYQIQPKKTKLKTLDSIKNKSDSKKTSESSTSTGQRSKNSEDSHLLEKHQPDTLKQDNLTSLKKNISKKVLFVDPSQKEKLVETTVKKTQRKKTVLSEVQGTNETEKKLPKSPEPLKIYRRLSKVKQSSERCVTECQNDLKKQIPIRKSRQSADSNSNPSAFKKSRSKSITSGQRHSVSSKMISLVPKPEKAKEVKEENMKIIMRDYYGEEDQEAAKKKVKGSTNVETIKRKRSTSKSNKQIIVSRQRVGSKSKEMATIKSRERVVSKSKEKVLGSTSKGRFA